MKNLIIASKLTDFPLLLAIFSWETDNRFLIVLEDLRLQRGSPNPTRSDDVKEILLFFG